MKRAALATIAFAGAFVWLACDETTSDPGPNPDPECKTPECIAALDGGAPPDGAPAVNPDGSIIDPIPFDAGVTPAPTCKGLFELCSGQECCSPYLCTNGTCR